MLFHFKCHFTDILHLTSALLYPHPPFFPAETGDAPIAVPHPHNNFVNWLHTSLTDAYQLTQEMPPHFTCTQHPGLHVSSDCFLLLMHVCVQCELWLVHSHRSGQSSISLSGCEAPTLRWGRWGRPCPPLCWSAEGSYAAPPPWTRSPAAGCPSAPPPPHRRAPLGCWQTGFNRKNV